MAQYRPFAFWDGVSTLPSGISQSQNILIGVDDQDYYNLGGLTWWAGPDESLGYVIAYQDPTLNHPNPLNIPCGIGFLRSSSLTDISFLETFNHLMASLSQPTLSNVNDAKAWLLANGYWTSFGESPWAYGNSSIAPLAPSAPSTPGINETLYWEGGFSGTETEFSTIGTNSLSMTQNIIVNNVSSDINGNPAGNQSTFLSGIPAGTLLEITNTQYPTQNIILEVNSVAPYYGSTTVMDISVTYVSGSATGGPYLFEFHFYSPTQNTGAGEWYFYSDEGPVNAAEPVDDGNALFITNTSFETYNPNITGNLFFNVNDTSGVSHLTEFQSLIDNSGTIMIYQNGDFVEYTSMQNDGGFEIIAAPGGSYLKIDTSIASIGQPAANPFVYADPITISISI